MKSTVPEAPFSMTTHACLRMTTRRVPARAVDAALLYGRVITVRGAEICAIGRKEIARYAREGIDLSRFHGVQVVCSPEGGILTVYRNRRFSLAARTPRRRRRRSDLTTR